MGCNYCNVPIYIKTTKMAKSLLAPATEAEALRQKLEDITGEVYVSVYKRYCPFCGRPAKGGGGDE